MKKQLYPKINLNRRVFSKTEEHTADDYKNTSPIKNTNLFSINHSIKRNRFPSVWTEKKTLSLRSIKLNNIHVEDLLMYNLNNSKCTPNRKFDGLEVYYNQIGDSGYSNKTHSRNISLNNKATQIENSKGKA